MEESSITIAEALDAMDPYKFDWDTISDLLPPGARHELPVVTNKIRDPTPEEWREEGRNLRKQVKAENERYYMEMIQSKDADETIMNQRWHLTEMHRPCPLPPSKSKSYEEVMETLKQKRSIKRCFPQPPGAADISFQAGNDVKAANKATHESTCWDCFCLPFVLHPFLSRFVSPEVLGKVHTLQIFSLKLTREGGRVDDALHVYGMMHLYSAMGFRYQVIFNRKREDCQVLTKMDPYLLLIGPALPPFLEEDRVRIQGTLKLKSTTQSEDTFLTVSLSSGQGKKHKFKEGDVGFQSQDTTDKHYLLEMTRCVVIFSSVATISVKVKQGVLPPDCRFTAFTASLPDMKVVLLDSKYGKVHTDVNHMVQLSRRTICVEMGGTLNVAVEHGGFEIAPLDFPFVNVARGSVETTDSRNIDVTNSCTLEVEVKWSNWSDRCNKY